MKKSTEERFWSKVDRTGDCWVWMAACSPKGYGLFWHEGKMVLAHRLAFEWANGGVPEGLQADHRCHQRNCVRPEHLRLVTNAQNSQNRRGATQASTTGVRGVSWDKRARKYRALVWFSGKQFFAGYYDTLKEAEAAVIAKRRELFTHDDYADWVTTAEAVPTSGASVL